MGRSGAGTTTWGTAASVSIVTIALTWGCAAESFAVEALPSEPTLPLALAARAAAAAVEQCGRDGYKVSAAVVDRAGVVKTLMRADGAGPHTTDSSRKKAYTAASLRRPTTELADLMARMPAIQALRDMNEHVLILGGGLPIEIGGDVVGAIGVGGAPGAHLDDACARAGLDAIGASNTVPEKK